MPTDTDFLIEYYKECQENLRWRATTEYRLIGFILTFYSIIIGLVLTKLPNLITQELSISIAMFFVLISLAIAAKICAEHEIYVALAEYTKKVWIYFNMFQEGVYLKNDTMLPEKLLNPKTGFGSGPGYALTLLIIGIITIAAIGVILWLGGL